VLFHTTGPRLQFNAISSLLDGNFVYGTTKEVVDALRTYEGGFLKTLPVFQEFGLKDLLPLKTTDPDDGCLRPQPDIYCFLAGDNRVNEQLVLSVVHTLFVREHNRIVYELQRINPHWDDETLYQEARHIVVALIQHITYNEFLPMVLGKEVMHKYGLILQKEASGYFGGYDPKVNPSAAEAFVTSAFRFGHSLLPSTIERWSTHHKYIGSQRLSELLRQPYDLYKGGWCDQYMCGLVNQVAQAMDDSVTQEVTNHLFQMPGMPFGFDLAAFNMQRGREQGVPSYNQFRHFCGLPKARHWHDLLGTMPNSTVKRYSEIYGAPDDIDLWSGGLSERPLPGSLVGPTFACIIGLQFRDLKVGDRFWFENGGWPNSFTLEQLQEIRQMKLSRLICDNSDKIEEVQVYAMVLPDHDMAPDDIDLWSGGLSERPLPGSLVGPTFACIIGLQFRDLKVGDRFWFENGGWPNSFTLEQLQEIRQMKLSRLICDNSDKIEEVQVYAMVLPDHDINPRVPCKSGILPRIDLSHWKDTRYPGPAPLPVPGPTVERREEDSAGATSKQSRQDVPISSQQQRQQANQTAVFGPPKPKASKRKDTNSEPYYRNNYKNNSSRNQHHHQQQPRHRQHNNNNTTSNANQQPTRLLPESEIFDRKTGTNSDTYAQSLEDKISEPEGPSIEDENYVGGDDMSIPTGTGIGTPGKVRVVHHGANGVKSITYVSPKALKSVIAPSSYGFGSLPPPGSPPGIVVHHFHPPTLTIHEHPSSLALLPGSAPAPLPPPPPKHAGGGNNKKKRKNNRGKKKSRISGWFKRND
ncbi:unnamed protein product, partial [Notodromas monacha]